MGRLRNRSKNSRKFDDLSEQAERKLQMRRIIKEGGSPVEDALQEIESEEYPEEYIEDELVDLERIAPWIAGEEKPEKVPPWKEERPDRMPHRDRHEVKPEKPAISFIREVKPEKAALSFSQEKTTQPLLDELSEKLNSMREKMTRSDIAIDDIRSESQQFHAQLARIDRDLKKLVSTYEDIAFKFEEFMAIAKKAPKPIEREPIELPQKKEEPIAIFDDVPIFRPHDSRSRVSAPSEIPTFEFVPARSTFPSELQSKTIEQPEEEKKQEFEKFRVESTLGQEPPSVKGKLPILRHISHDHLTLVLVMRWIEFLLERVPRDKISLVMDYYKDIGWISAEVKTEILAYARGEMQDISKYMAAEEARDDTLGAPEPPAFGYKKIDDWRLSADDHLKSLLFILKIANINVDKDRLNYIEQMIQNFKESLESFHGV